MPNNDCNPNKNKKTPQNTYSKTPLKIVRGGDAITLVILCNIYCTIKGVFAKKNKKNKKNFKYLLLSK